MAAAEAAAAGEMRFLFYSPDGHGLGHTRRSLALAAALGEASPEIAVIVATGSPEAEELGVPPGVDVLRLPALDKLGGGYAPAGCRCRDARSGVCVQRC